ncbi:MAG: hypothetical protein H6R01_501 [Burkholderiaceae bacterium]|nr:hypothetical protein [Burkholderiaceae bacterium]
MFAVLHTRAELLAVEVEEEVLRLFSYLMLSLVALVCFGVAALLLILLVIVAFWDTYRLAAIVVLTGAFGAVAVGIGLYVRNALRTKPRFLSATLSELEKDVDMLRPKRSPEVEP